MQIERFRGDTYPIKITLKSNGDFVNLDDIDETVLSIAKSSGVVSTTCTKDSDPTSGVVYADMNSTIVDDKGSFPFDVQVVWLDGTKTTFLKDTIVFKGDINTN